MNTAYSAKSKELLAYFTEHFINRFDVWGGFYEEDGQVIRTTKPSKEKRNTTGLTDAIILRHINATSCHDVIGAHGIQSSDYSVCKWCAFDFDAHSDKPEADAAKNKADAKKVIVILDRLKIRHLLEDSDGKGGLHLWVIWDKPVKSDVIFRFGNWLKKEADIPDTEFFPKQKDLTEKSKYGNWLRLPGKHHKREHWSGFEVNGEFVYDEKAVNYLLTFTPADSSLIPDIEEETPKSVPNAPSVKPAITGKSLPIYATAFYGNYFLKDTAKASKAEKRCFPMEDSRLSAMMASMFSCFQQIGQSPRRPVTKIAASMIT